MYILYTCISLSLFIDVNYFEMPRIMAATLTNKILIMLIGNKLNARLQT